jgi:hypothetical protein
MRPVAEAVVAMRLRLTHFAATSANTLGLSVDIDSAGAPGKRVEQIMEGRRGGQRDSTMICEPVQSSLASSPLSKGLETTEVS